MRIAIYAHLLTVASGRQGAAFARPLIRQLVQDYPGHQWLLIFHSREGCSVVNAPNVEYQMAGPRPTGFWTHQWWYAITIPKLLRRWKADVYFDLEAACSLRTMVPQVMMVYSTEAFHFPQWLPRWKRAISAQRFAQMVQKAKRLLVPSPFLQTDIAQRTGKSEGSVMIAPPWADGGFAPLNWEQKLHTLEAETEGAEYFLFAGTMHPSIDWVMMLKAFSRFKKWQKSSMKLVMVATEPGDFTDFETKLASYKYRGDVVWLGFRRKERRMALSAAAYAFIYPALYDGFAMPVLEALQSGTPVITSALSSMPQLAGEAALYADPSDAKALADALIKLYKDERLKTTMAAAAIRRANDFEAGKTCAVVMQALAEAAANN